MNLDYRRSVTIYIILRAGGTTRMNRGVAQPG
jgi:hypothetical protein